MSKYFLPVSINNRRSHICHFIPEGSNEDCHFFEFIVQNSGNECELLHIRPQTAFISSRGTHHDIQVHNTSIVKDDNNDGSIIELNFTKGGTTRYDTNIYDGAGIYIRKEKSGSIRIAINTRFKSEKIELRLKLLEENGTSYFFYKCVFHVVNANSKLIEAGIDFGSDSSQMAYRDVTGKDRRFNSINIIRKLKEFYKSNEKDIDYYQYEENEGNIPLFKSFFTVCTKPINDVRIFLKPYANEEKTFINALLAKGTTDLDEMGLKLLPNLKYLQIKAGLDYDETIVDHSMAFYRDKDSGEIVWRTPDQIEVPGPRQVLSNYHEHFKRYFLNYFLHVLFRQVSDNYSQPFLKIKLLVPNVYNQGKIFKLKHNIYKDFKEIVKEYEKDYRIKGIEIETISESDASFLGLIYKNNLIDESNRVIIRKNSLYLLIDGGKGTLDFTIIRSGDSTNQYDSIYRGGIPGSGQVLNYAIMQIFNDGLKPYGINLQSLIDKANSLQKNEFLKAIENAKKYCQFIEDDEKNLFHYVTTEHINSIPWIKGFLRTKNLEYITNMINALAQYGIKISDLNGRLKSAVNTLTDAIKKEVLNFKNLHNYETNDTKLFLQIILSGRAFRFNTLEDTIKQKLEDFSDEIAYPKNHAKTGCLEGVMSSGNYKINLNSLMIGFPNIMTTDDLGKGEIYKIVNNEVIRKVRLGAQSNSEGISIVTIIKWIKSLFSKENNDFKPKKQETKIDESLILFGLNIDSKRYTDLKLSLPGEIHTLEPFAGEKLTNLFFTEKEFLHRSKSVSNTLDDPETPNHSNNLMNFSNYPIIKSNINLTHDLTDNPLDTLQNLIKDARIDPGSGSSGGSTNSESGNDGTAYGQTDTLADDRNTTSTNDRKNTQYNTPKNEPEKDEDKKDEDNTNNEEYF